MAKPVFALAIGAVLAISTATALAGCRGQAHHRLLAGWPMFRLRAARPASSGKLAVIVVLVQRFSQGFEGRDRRDRLPR